MIYLPNGKSERIEIVSRECGTVQGVYGVIIPLRIAHHAHGLITVLSLTLIVSGQDYSEGV